MCTIGTRCLQGISSVCTHLDAHGRAQVSVSASLGSFQVKCVDLVRCYHIVIMSSCLRALVSSFHTCPRLINSTPAPLLYSRRRCSANSRYRTRQRKLRDKIRKKYSGDVSGVD